MKRAVNHMRSYSELFEKSPFVRNPCSGISERALSMKPNKVVPRYPTLALEKGLDILALFASEPAGVTKS